MSKNLNELANEVHDEQTFLEFLLLLSQDREDEIQKELIKPSSPYEPDTNGWENGSIEAFLEAAHAWGTASATGLVHYEVPDNPWTRAAHIILAGKLYE